MNKEEGDEEKTTALMPDGTTADVVIATEIGVGVASQGQGGELMCLIDLTLPSGQRAVFPLDSEQLTGLIDDLKASNTILKARAGKLSCLVIL